MDDEKMIQHNKNKRILKGLGITLLAMGLIFVIIAFVDFFSSLTGGGMEMPKLFWLFFVGFPAMAIGGVLTLLGFKRGIMTYVKNEAVPVINEAASDLSGAISGVAHSIKRGLNNDNINCECGAFNKKDSKFCIKCGTKLTSHCANCGNLNENEAKYCNNCGSKLS